jgi:hypothetical protein
LLVIAEVCCRYSGNISSPVETLLRNMHRRAAKRGRVMHRVEQHEAVEQYKAEEK